MEGENEMGFMLFLLAIAAVVMLLVNPTWLRTAVRELFVCWVISGVSVGAWVVVVKERNYSYPGMCSDNILASIFCGLVITPFVWGAYRVVRFALQSNEEAE